MDINVELDLNTDLIDNLIEDISDAEGMVIYKAPYSLFVEVDTTYDNKKPPFKPIHEWVQRNITTDEAEAENITYAIINKIYQDGIEGVYYLTRTADEFTQKWKPIAEKRANENDYENIFSDIIKNIMDEILISSNNKLQQANKIDTGNLLDSGVTVFGIQEDGIDVNSI